MIESFLIFDAEPVPGMGHDLAGVEILGEKTAGVSQDNQGVRRRIAVAARPEGINAADDWRKPVLGAEEIDGTGLAVIGGEDSGASAFFRRQSVADVGDRLD